MVTRFPALFYPLGNWLCLLFMAAVLVIMLMTPGDGDFRLADPGMDCGAGRGLPV
ncbi:Aromatic amino acid transport protein AroP [Klebsiella pneumoniae subsp. pneumoniae]|nr:Aromatic amino acid transport protein AroP [Klebsiella pneumoniae subsp. pneumoniae]